MDRGHPAQHAVGHGARCPRFDDDVWELYDTNDWTQAHDLAAEEPEKLHELQRLFLIEAAKYNVLPRRPPWSASTPTSPAARAGQGRHQLLFGGMGRLTENSVLNLKNKSHAVTAEIDVPEAGAEGVIIAQGGAFAGWALYAKDGKLTYCYNLLGLQEFNTEARHRRCRRAPTRCAWSSPTTAAGSPRAATSPVRRWRQVGRGPSRGHRADDVLRRRDLRHRLGHRLTGELRLHERDSRFTGIIKWVQLDIGHDDHDHLITPEERFRGDGEPVSARSRTPISHRRHSSASCSTCGRRRQRRPSSSSVVDEDHPSSIAPMGIDPLDAEIRRCSSSTPPTWPSTAWASWPGPGGSSARATTR